jgi:hypothetical protein
MAGRPSTLTSEIANAIEEKLLKGGFIEPSVVSCGVPKRTFYDWMAKGKRDEEAGDTETVHAQFAWHVQVALAKAEIELIEKLQRESNQWKRYAWMLERRFKDRWAMKRELGDS